MQRGDLCDCGGLTAVQVACDSTGSLLGSDRAAFGRSQCYLLAPEQHGSSGMLWISFIFFQDGSYVTANHCHFPN